MVEAIEIAGRRIGPGYPCFIIAEAGVNHNGDVDLAKRLVDISREVGADAVKFQTWITEKLILPDAAMAEYQQQNIGIEQSQSEMLKRMELSYEQYREIKAYADQQEILFFSTPDEEDSADFLDELGVLLFKIGSGEVTNLPLIRHVARMHKPIILSTGMSSLGDVEAAVRVMEETSENRLILLHCVSSYPSIPSDSNLRAMDTMSVAFGYPVGFSDHTMGYEVTLAAVARGACVIEKHLTLDRKMTGPDHRASLNPDEFAAMVRAIRTIESALGDGIKQPTLAELEVKKVVQKTIVTTKTVRVGETITLSDLTLKRSSGGLSPRYLEFIIGRKMRIDVAVNQTISLNMLE